MAITPRLLLSLKLVVPMDVCALLWCGKSNSRQLIGHCVHNLHVVMHISLYYSVQGTHEHGPDSWTEHNKSCEITCMYNYVCVCVCAYCTYVRTAALF